jgi:hypothetical protein
MHRRKSIRHQHAANARWRADKAQRERDDGIPDRAPMTDARQPCVIDLRGAGGPMLTLEPRLGYIAWRQRDEAGAVTDCAALKTLLHRLADMLPRTLSAGAWEGR